ncbi:cell division protein FtsQ/DivIB [Prosthecobacter dejongeii]|uniref:Cell division septal protein FtsQ n=2 Tax=Prosthecobacter dejongeii TaxID=48465 RepID=A0A7W7YM04_9BACT|nr:FtsQ-type POTRA domain-containing protein [Prosthecobacter dejongeii]MBB5038457.1 cell division septal protein FtsQ [Prosthecobacter dejongeii]
MPSPKKASAPAPKPPRPAAKKQPAKVGGVTMDVCLRVDSPKIREMEKKAAHRRGFKWALGLIAIICFFVLVKITVQEAILKNPQFELQDVAVQTRGPLSVEKIVRATLLTRGENLLTINMRALHTRLRQLPPVKDVAIERDFDAGLMTLRITQRQPVAWLDCPRLGMIAGRPEVGHLLDHEAVPFPCETVTETLAALPVIRYAALAQKTAGTAIQDLQLTSALKLLRELEERFEKGQPQVRSLDIQTPYSMLATFADKSVITFGVDDLDVQLARLDRIRLEARQRRWEIGTLNLLARQNVPITFRQPPDLAGLQPESPVPVTLSKTTSAR